MRRFNLFCLGLLLVGFLACSQRAIASDPVPAPDHDVVAADAEAWDQLRHAQLDHQAQVLSLWFASWRSQAVGRAWLAHAGRLKEIDTVRCSPARAAQVAGFYRMALDMAEHHGLSLSPSVLLDE